MQCFYELKQQFSQKNLYFRASVFCANNIKLHQKVSILIYTDGSAKGNPGRGGYGVVMLSGKHRKEISKGFLLTTNNRMELWRLLLVLKTLKN